MTTPERVAVVVTGMHRTGSSAMTRVLSLAGATLPARLLDPSPGNPTGHWEPLEVLRLDDALLTALGSDWCDPRAFGLRGGAAVSEAAWFTRAARVLAEDYGDATTILLKDPRTSLLMSFWSRALIGAGYSPRVVVMVRDPVSVARSLERRNGFPVSQSVLLWASYMLAAERDTRSLPRVFVGYDDLLADGRGALRRVDAELSLGLRADGAAKAIDAFLDRDLRHFARDTHQAQPVWDLAERLGAWFAAAARDDVGDPAVLDAAVAELSALMAIMAGALENLRGDRDRLIAELQALRSRVAELGGSASNGYTGCGV